MSFTDSAARPDQWRTTALVVSLCLNVGLVALLLVGAVRVSAPGGTVARPSGPLAPAQVMRILTPERRLAVREVARKHQEALARLRLAARQARAQSFRVLSAEPYDDAAFGVALQKVATADNALEEEAITQTRDLAAALTPQERGAIMERRRQQAQRPPLIRRLLNGN